MYNNIHWLDDCLQSVTTVHARTLGRTGTGFVVSADGHLLTAAHCVVDDSGVPNGDPHATETDITVVFRRGNTARAVLIGFDMHADVAVLRVPVGTDSRDFPRPIPVRRHTYPHPGDTCVIIGNLFGQDPHSVAVGTVRNGRWYDPHGLSLLSSVLTDVATGTGTSGGPILDAAGHVVALHTAAYGAMPTVCADCGEAFRSASDLHGHADSAGHPAGGATMWGVPVGRRTTQLGGGVAAPMLWHIYLAILVRGSQLPGTALPRCTLPCDTIPCVPGNVWRIRAALGKDSWNVPPAAAGCCVVRPDAGSGLLQGDVVAADVHEQVWLLVPGRACVVQVVRGTQSMDLTVRTRLLPGTRDVATGYTQYTSISFGDVEWSLIAHQHAWFETGWTFDGTYAANQTYTFDKNSDVQTFGIRVVKRTTDTEGKDRTQYARFVCYLAPGTILRLHGTSEKHRQIYCVWAILNSHVGVSAYTKPSVLATNVFSVTDSAHADVIECTNQGTVWFGKVWGRFRDIASKADNLWRANSLQFFSDLEYTDDDDDDSVSHTTPSTLKYRVEKVETTRAHVTVVYNGKYANLLFTVHTEIRRFKAGILVRAIPRLISRLLVKEDVVGTYGAKTKLTYTVDDWDLAPRLTTVTGGEIHVDVDGPHVIRFKCKNSAAKYPYRENMYLTTVHLKASGRTLVFRRPRTNTVKVSVQSGAGTITPVDVPSTVSVENQLVSLRIEGRQTAHEYDLECLCDV